MGWIIKDSNIGFRKQCFLCINKEIKHDIEPCHSCINMIGKGDNFIFLNFKNSK